MDLSKIRIRRKSVNKTFTLSEDMINLFRWLCVTLRYKYDVNVLWKAIETLIFLVKEVQDGSGIVVQRKNGETLLISAMFEPVKDIAEGGN